MGGLLNTFKSNKAQIFLLLCLLILLSLFTWNETFYLTLRGVSFFYLVERLQHYYWNSVVSLTTFGVGAVLLGKSLTYSFGVNMIPYYLVEIIVMTLINITFFLTIFIISHKKSIAFISSLIFAVNYFGNFDMYVGGIYAYFLERIPPMLFLLPSFLLLHLHLQTKSFKYLVASLAVFFAGIGLYHFAILFTGPFLLYPLCWYFFNPEQDKRVNLKGVLISLSFLAISGFFVIIQGMFDVQNSPPLSLVTFITSPQVYHYPEMMLRQLVYWSEYPAFVKGISLDHFKYVNTPMHTLVPITNAVELTWYIAAFYLVCFYLTYTKLPAFRALLLTMVLGTASIFFLNTYFGQYQVATQPGPHRYLYLPTITLAVFWGIVLSLLFDKKNWRKVILGLVVITAYYSINTWVIKQNFVWIFERDLAVRNIWEYIISQRPKLTPGTVVALDDSKEELSYEVEFLNDQLSKREVKYMQASKLQEKLNISRSSIIFLTYDKNCSCVKETKD